MIKALAITSVIALASITGAQAAEVGIRHSAGHQHETITHGNSWSSYNGSVRSNTTSIDRASGGVGRNGIGGTTSSYDSTTARTVEYYRGGQNNRFAGGSGSTFSETSIFAR